MSKDNAILVAEFIGTFLLTGAVLMGANPFVALGIIVLLIGGISGAHVNPAVSAAMASVKKLSVERMVAVLDCPNLRSYCSQNSVWLYQGRR